MFLSMPVVSDFAHDAIVMIEFTGFCLQYICHQVHDRDRDLLVVDALQDVQVIVSIPGPEIKIKFLGR